ncbi:MAG: GNAT family N-acetyltransferase [Ardenticatenaceae bacterium]|nr:GNAT family N-acetyltransferase [Ardenticatenaceae bacterium]
MIRAATEADAPAMGHLLVTTWLTAHKGQIPEGQWQARQANWTPAVSAQGWAETLRAMAAGDDPDYCIYLAVATAVSEPESTPIIGLVMGGAARAGSWADAGEIYVLYVRADRQGQGIGKRLLATAVHHLAQLGLTKLVIGCLANNYASAWVLYEAWRTKVGELQTEDEGFVERQVIYGWQDSSYY